MKLFSRRRQPILPLVALLTILVLAPAAYLITRHPGSAEAAWFDNSWGFRQAIAIPSHTTAENNVYVTVPAFDATDTTKFQADCGDLRFTKQNGELLPYYVLDCDATANVHVFFDTLPAGASTYYMYYGNPGIKNGTEAADFATAASNVGAQSAGTEQKSEAPIAYWKFDEGTGQNLSDSAQNANLGTLGANSSSASDDPTWAPADQCISGRCLYLDGSDDFVNIPNSSSFNQTDEVTMSLWVRNQRVSGKNTFLAANASGVGGYGIYLDTNDKLEFFVYWSSGTPPYSYCISNYVLPKNTWTHVAGVFLKNNYLKVYANGQQVASCSPLYTTAIGSPNTAMKLGWQGWWGGGTDVKFQGYIDEFKVYPYARTAAQIKADFKARSTAKGSSVSLGGSNKNLDALSNGLVGYWKTDEATWSGTLAEVVDSSGNANHGQAQGTTGGKAYPTTGKFGNAGFFDGVDDAVLITDNAVLDGFTSMSIFFWAKPTVSATKEMIIKHLNTTSDINWELFQSSANIGGRAAGSGVTCLSTGNLFTTNVWHQVGMTWDSRNIYIFIDGVLNNTCAQTATMTNSVGNLSIGRYESGLYSFSGPIDEIRLYNRALSPAEVSQLYSWAPGPVAYWNLDEKTGANANDRTGNSQTGTLSAGASWISGKFGSGIKFNNTATGLITVSDNAIQRPKEISVSYWMYINSITSFGVPFVKTTSGSWNDGYGFYIRGAASQFNWWTDAYLGSNRPVTITVPSTGRWHHVEGTFDQTSGAKLYIDGVLAGTATSTTAINHSTSSIQMGYHAGGSAFDGYIDDVRIYNYARSQKQIVEDMNAGHPVGGSPVGSQIGYWKFDEGYGDTTYDSSPQKVNGDLAGSCPGAATCPTWSNAGKFGKALFFDGGDYVSLGNITAYKTDTKTITFWANPSAAPSATTAVVAAGNHGNWYVGFTTSGRMISSHLVTDSSQQTTASPANSVPGNQWHHYAYVWSVSGSNVTVRLYKDGAKLTDTTYSTGYYGTYGSGFLLGSYATGSNFYDGLADEIKIYNSALTDDEVKLDMNRGAAQVLGTLSDTSALTGGSVASSSAQAAYCVPGDSTSCAAPVGEWNFEEGQGATANDSSGNGNAGSWVGTGSHWTQGKYGKTGNFNGSDDRIDIYSTGFNNVFNGNEGTISLWAKSNDWGTTANAPRLITLQVDANNYMYIRKGTTANQLQFYRNGNNILDGYNATVTNNGWMFITLTWSASSDKLIAYINGQSLNISTTLGSWSGSLSSTGTVIGDNATSGSQMWNGQIDQVRIYNYARTAAQVAWDYNQGKPVGWWKFDECQGATANDSSGNGNSGTITIGATVPQTAVGTCSTASTAWGNGVTGKFNSSLNFDGADDYVSFSRSSSIQSIASAGTISTWVKYNSADSTLRTAVDIAGTGANGLVLFTQDGTTNKGRLQYGNGTTTIWVPTTTVFTTGTWYHIVGTWTSSGGKIYVNGNQEGTSAVAPVITIGAGTSYIGSNNTIRFHDGQLDDVRVYNYTLTATQVKQIYNGGAGIRFAPATGSP